MNTPIRRFAELYRDADPLRLHMPGHGGLTDGGLGCEALDITEVQGADDLSCPGGVILESENNTSALYGSRHTFYSAGGSSQCVKAMLYLAYTHRPEGAGRRIIAARNAHKSFLHGCALLGLEPDWLLPGSESPLCSCPVGPEALSGLLSTGEKPCAVYITSPDYLGGTQDTAALAGVCHAHGVPLLVDNAHGAYLKFLSPSRHPLDLGADMCCDSAHKTLPVLTGGAYLHVARGAMAPYEASARQALAVFGSSSPSYLILQSLDLCAAWLDELCAAYCESLQQGLAPGEYLTPPFSPGYGDWDLAAQQTVLDRLQAPKRLGLSLTGGGMLVPEKSVTALVGISDRPEEACGQKCMRCRKTDCPFRAGPA